MEESGPEPRDEEDRRTSRPTRRGHRRLKTPPKPPHARRNPAKVEEPSTTATPEGRGGRRHAPDWLSSTLAEDRDAPGRGERSKSQEELPVCAPSSACLEREGEVSARSTTDESVEERQRLPRRREELTEEGDPPLERSKHDHRTHTRRPTATPARAGHALTPLVTRHARTSSGSSRQNASPSRRHSHSTKSGRPSSRRRRARDTPRRCCRSGHTRQDSRCSQGRGARQAHEELGKLLQKQTGERQLNAPPEQEGRPPLLQATGG